MKTYGISLASLVISSLLAGAAMAGPTLLQPGTTYTEPAPFPNSVPRQAVPTLPPIDHTTQYAPFDSEQPVQPYIESRPIELYQDVTYRDLRRVHPCAVPYLIDVPLPQPRRQRGCVQCGPTCVTIKVCVPPCTEPCVKVRRRGHKFIYDFGKYEVNVMVRPSGRIIVNYDA